MKNNDRRTNAGQTRPRRWEGIGLGAGKLKAVGVILSGFLAVWASGTQADDKSPPPQKPGKFALQVASFDQIQQEIARHKGKVVVVDYWSSWCAPCVKELPELVQLHQKLGDKIICLTVDVDYAGTEGETPEQHRENVQAILLKHGATMRGFLCSDPDLTVFEKLKVGSVPVLQVFDREGKLHKGFDNESGAYGDEGFSILKHVQPVVLGLLR